MLVLVIVVMLAVAGAAAYLVSGRGGGTGPSTTGCSSPGSGEVSRSTLKETEFGAVREYALPLPQRWSNAITVAEDGSVWFGEEAVPGVGHLFGNGTLVEYPWPYQDTPTAGCGYKTGIWGVVMWNGAVWATASDENLIVGTDQKSGRTTVINLTKDAQQPYTLALAPDGDLWFTALSSGAKLGRITPDLKVSVLPVDGLKREIPIQVSFVNSSLAYFVAIDPLSPYGHMYSFDPSSTGQAIDPVLVGGAFSLLEPASVSAAGGLVWVTQHGASSIADLQASSGVWTVYPTTVVNYTYTTLPYFVEAGGEGVWFNEHYANRIGFLNVSDWTLTEFSEANPPVESGSLIGNDLTFAKGSGGVWFTATTGNYVGFVSDSIPLGFSVESDGPNVGNLTPGKTISLNLTVQGSADNALQFSASDSENYTSIPKLLRIAPSVQLIGAGLGIRHITVQVTELDGLKPGNYTMALGFSDGLVTRSAYFYLDAH
jgi:streptogramin lyase